MNHIIVNSHAQQWLEMSAAAGLNPLVIRHKNLLPIVQGGMGVGVSASKLAGAVARLGGIDSHAEIKRLQNLAACGVQLGTAFAVTQECDASATFKHILAQAQPQDIVEFTSVAGLPARAVRTPWLDKYLRILPVLQERAHVKAKCNMSFDCLQHCGLRDGNADIGQFCIDQQLGHALKGDAQRGLFFRGAGSLPFGSQIRSVADLVMHLLTPAPAQA